jgi:heme exporter protein D
MWQSWHQFFAMGGYAAYVWSAYGIAAVVLAANIAAPMIAHRRIKRRIRQSLVDDLEL